MNDLRAAETENLIPGRYFFGRNYAQQNSLCPDPRSELTLNVRGVCLCERKQSRWSSGTNKRLTCLLRRNSGTAMREFPDPNEPLLPS